MKKVIVKVLMFIMLFIVIISTEVWAYSSGSFKFDLPDGFKENKRDIPFLSSVNEGKQYTYIGTTEEAAGWIDIYEANIGERTKSVRQLTKKDVEDIVKASTSSVKENFQYTIDQKAKLGKEDAIKVTTKYNIYGLNYCNEAYLMTSGTYMYIVVFNGEDEIDLQKECYQTVKDSFKITRKYSTEFMVVMLIIVVLIVTVIFNGNRNVGKMANIEYNRNKFRNPYINEKIDYKNLTEEDFKKMDEM